MFVERVIPIIFQQENNPGASNIPREPSLQPTRNDSVECQWHLTFQVPSAFSSKTEKAISTGVLLKKHRIEIVQALSTSMLVYTKCPTGEHYNKVCEKLIEKYPTMKDEIGTSGYVSYSYYTKVFLRS